MTMALKRSMSFLYKLRSAVLTPQPSSSFAFSRSFNIEAPLMEDVMMEIPVMKGVRRGWNGVEEDQYIYFRMDVPGLSEKHIKVIMEKKRNTNTLTIEGEIRENELGSQEAKEKDKEDEVVIRRYKATINIPPKFFQIDHLHSEIKNGVFKLGIPKVGRYGNRERLIEFTIPNMEENPFLQGVRRNWCTKVEDGYLMVRIDMPGLCIEDVACSRGEDQSLLILGQGKDYEENGKRQIRCRVMVDPTKFFYTVTLNSMENGVYLLIIPPRRV